jgi:hypothetical protein
MRVRVRRTEKASALRWAVLLVLFAFIVPDIAAAERSTKAIHLWFGGDVHFGKAGPDPLIPLRAVTRDRIGIVNLEGPIHEPAETIVGNRMLRLYNSAGAPSVLLKNDVLIANVANNHQDDAGRDERERTEQALREAGIMPVGGTARSVLLTVRGYRLIIASYDLSTMLPAGLEDELSKLHGTGDLLIVLFHVAGSPGYLPAARLRSAVDAAVRAGARIIVSHGSHVVGPVERRRGSIIAWGLGNLAFNCACTEEYEAIILQVSIDPTNRKKPIVSACVVPIHAGLQGRESVLARDGSAVLDLLEAIGSDRLERKKGKACF